MPEAPPLVAIAAVGRRSLELQRYTVKTAHLAQVGQRLLIQLLGVANVARYDRVKRELLACLEVVPQLFGADGDSASNGVLGLEDSLVDGIVGDYAVGGIARSHAERRGSERVGGARKSTRDRKAGLTAGHGRRG